MIVPASWAPILGDQITKPYFRNLQQFLAAERAQHQVFPAADHVFNAFELTPFDQVRVVILGQDPYHDIGQAHGLAFSVQPGVKVPASLRNLFKELKDDVGCAIPKHGCLIPWARQGVLMLNAVLTVRAHEANSHRAERVGDFSDAVIQKLSERADRLIIVLWGKPAQGKKKLIADTHVVLEAAHPSPLSAYNGFFGSKPFSKINAALRGWGKAEIDWQIPDDVKVP